MYGIHYTHNLAAATIHPYLDTLRPTVDCNILPYNRTGNEAHLWCIVDKPPPEMSCDHQLSFIAYTF